MLILTTSYYDPVQYEPIGLVNGVSVHAISAIRGIFSGLAGVFGGKQELLEKKFLDVREEAIAALEGNAKQMGATAVIALKVETSELGNEFVVFTAMGTAIRQVRKGGRKTNKKVNSKNNSKNNSKK